MLSDIFEYEYTYDDCKSPNQCLACMKDTASDITKCDTCHNKTLCDDCYDQWRITDGRCPLCKSHIGGSSIHIIPIPVRPSRYTSPPQSGLSLTQ